MSSDDDDFGPTVPPLSIFIQKILNRYPDGGQILKELLQNAEDAGASVVKFLHDKSSYSTNNLLLANLQDCQGPALCVYNDAEFQKCDWKGIQEPQRSHKSDSVLKVGRFGIGFNSVYHLTDIPWLLSGKKLVVFEPTEELLNGNLRNEVKSRSGFSWDLSNSDHQREISNHWQQFLPIDDAVSAIRAQNGSFTNQWQFKGTIFRLPFRSKPSSMLSPTVYTDQMIQTSFNEFVRDGAGLLLFLLKVENIELLRRNMRKSAQPQYAVKIARADSDKVKRDKNALSEKIRNVAEIRKRSELITHSLKMDTHFGIEEIIDGVSKEKKWIVSHFLPNQSEAPRAWSLESGVKRLPWVSVAAQVGEAVEGGLFCFLPLPRNPDLVTGLPIHVNAYFGIADNRRSLKWPGVDQTRDLDAQWNEALRDEVIPYAYVQLVCYCRDKFDAASYSLWPDISKVHERWRSLLDQFYKLLFQQAVLKVSSNGNWTRLNSNVFIDNLDKTCQPNVAAAVRHWLNSVQTCYVHAPENVIAGIENYSRVIRGVVNYITPAVVRNELIVKCRNWNIGDQQNRVLLLEYFVTKCAIPNDLRPVINLVLDLPLIPLLNGGFGALHSLQSTNVMYLVSKKHQELLPSLQNCCINVEGLSGQVMAFLTQVSHFNYGIVKINETNFPTILRGVLPDLFKSQKNFNYDLNSSNFPNRTWLLKLWELLRADYPDLSHFVGLSILECGQQIGYSYMIALPNQNTSVLFVQGAFSPHLEQLLTSADAISVPSTIIQQHVALVKYIIHVGNIQNLMKLLQSCDGQKLQVALNANVAARKALVTFLAKSVHEIPPEGRNVLRKLPIFEVLVWPRTINANAAAVSVDYCCTYWQSVMAINFEGLPSQIQSDVPLLDCRNSEYSSLAQWLCIERATQSELANGIIQQRNSYGVDTFSLLALWCMDYVQAWNVKNSLKDFQFVCSDEGLYQAPIWLFDPTEDELKTFFSGEFGKFPSAQYASPKALEFLRGLGLRTSANNITADEIVQTANAIDKLGSGTSSKCDRFMQILRTHFNKLTTTQTNVMKDLKLFCAKTDPPKDFPSNLPWFGTGKQSVRYSAVNMAQEECAFVVGSVMPVLGTALPQDLVNAFGFVGLNDIEPKLVVSQLKIYTEHFHNLQVNNPNFQSMMYKVYKTLSKIDASEVQAILTAQDVQEWVWVGNTFLQPTNVVAKWTYFRSGLEPYVYSLPGFLQEQSLEMMFLTVGVLEDDGPNLARRVLHEIINKHRNGSVTESESKTDFNYVRSILEILSDNLNGDEDLEIPIKRNALPLTFLPASRCKFNDSGSYDFLDGFEDEEDDIILVHGDLSHDLCRKLGVTALSNAVLDAEVFEQQESIVQRLKNIVEEYPAGDTIFQELIQNADDAGAKEIGFLLDMRDNGQWRQSVLWKQSGMDKFQGPALWVFNDAVFTEEDFKNILSIGGATKRSQSEKIGSFGVGFNSVYNVTDIPSFLSGNYLVYFDPQKLCVPNGAGGIKFNLKTKPNKLKAFSDQFSPYKDVFGCDLSYNREGVSYPSTLFRLPLRNSEMVASSQLCNLSYNMKNLLKTFAETRNSVMLFLQHIQELNVQFLSSINTSPLDMQTVLTIRKVATEIQTDIANQEIFTKVVKRFINENRFVTLRQTNLVKMKCADSGSDSFLPVIVDSGISWIVHWSASKGTAYQLAATSEGAKAGLMPAVAIAACVKEVHNKFEIEPISGNVFCYLPLPVQSGLPFHVHAPFALGSSRRHLWTENVKDESNLKSKWNEALKTDALVECFGTLLDVIKRLDETGQLVDYSFYSLWPCHGQVQSDFSGFLTGVYNHLCTTDKYLWKTEDGRWVGSSHVCFLLLSPHWSERFVEEAQKALQISLKPPYGFVLVSPEVQTTLQNLVPEYLERRSYTDDTFFENIFFPNLLSYDSDLANFILLEILGGNNIKKPLLVKLLQETHCIPSSPDGDRRLMPRDLIDNESEIRRLYDENDGKFPYGAFRKSEIRNKLASLGMLTAPTGEMLLDRAKTVQNLVETGRVEEAKCRSSLILKALCDISDDSWYDNFLNISFMFSVQPPANWTLPWYEPEDGKVTFTPKEISHKSKQNLVCFASPLWDDEGLAHDKTLRLAYHLSFGSPPGVESVIIQLEILARMEVNKFSKIQLDLAQRVATDCLMFLDKDCSDSSDLLNRIISMRTVILKPVGAVPYNMVCSEALAANCAPYLFSIKETAYEECSQLLQRCGVKKSFSIQDYIDALKKIRMDCGEDCLSKPLMRVVLHFCTKISKFLTKSKQEEVLKYKEELLVPDTRSVLLLASSLTFWELDMKEIPDELMVDANFCSRDIPRDVAVSLGVQLQRSAVLDKFSDQFFADGEAFGQYENLTTRIRNILAEYSNKSDVISEMIQNADDAGATEIRFILDERQLPTNPKTLLSDNWKYLQGPALVVYNNKPFTKEDFEGIRKLGLGSKPEKPELTGKFGIGFNTVYHLTDVPMFVSNGEKLCVLDPHRQYVPTARVTAPGGLFNITENFKKIYSGVLPGFLPVEDLEFAQSTVFRLPLRRPLQSLTSEIGGGTSVEEMKNMLTKFVENAKDYLIFLRNVEKIQIISVNARGIVERDFVYYYEMSDEDRHKKIDFFRDVYSNVQLNADAVVQYRLRLFDSFKKDSKEWLILQRMSCMKNDVPGVLTDLIARKELVASPMVGIATPLGSSSINESKMYTTLPLPGSLALQVHLNAKFILDSGRKHCYLHNDGTYKTLWNNYLIVNVLAPLYVQALESLKENLSIQWNNSVSKFAQEEFARKYQMYFPITTNLGQIELLLITQVYQLIHANNLKLLFGVTLGKDSKRQLMWLSTGEGILDFLDENFGAATEKLNCIKNVLEKVDFPKFHRGFNEVIKQVSKSLNFELKTITPSLVAGYMKTVSDDKLILPTSSKKCLRSDQSLGAQKKLMPYLVVRTDAQSLPTEIANTVLYEDEMRHYCLNYILTGGNNVNLDGIPLLLTADDLVRRFSSIYELYHSSYYEFLPSQGELFCSSKLNVTTIPAPYCQQFTITSIARHISVEFPHLENVEKLETDEIDNLIWKIFKFMSNFKYDKTAKPSAIKQSLIQYIKPLENWALLPVHITDVQNRRKNYMVALKNAPLAVHCTPLPNSHLREVLQNLGCMFTNVDKIRENTSSFFNYLCVTTDYPSAVVALLHHMCENFSRINDVEKSMLLQYIIDHYSHLGVRNEDVKCYDIDKIKSLPLFQTVEGRFIPLNEGNQTYVTCDGEIEGAELDTLMSLQSIVLLASKLGSNKSFCENLGIKKLRPIDVYKNYIIPYLHSISLKALIKHLKWIKLCENKDKSLCEQLGSKPLIANAFGQMKAVEKFYDENVRRMFESMMSKEDFIPQSFWTAVAEECGTGQRILNEWESFFKKLGLKTKLCSDVFLALTKKHEANEKTMDDCALQNGSRLLVEYLAKIGELYKDVQLLSNLSTVKFVYAHHVDEELDQLYEQTVDFKGLICFRDSVIEKQERICWSVCKLLPKWSTNFSTEATKHLGYCETSTVHHVVAHVENICQRLQPLKYNEFRTENVNSKEAIDSLRRITDAIFKFLDENIDELDENLVGRMRNVPCTLVELGRKLVCASQVVTESFIECPPFLYILPEEMFPFIRVLQKFGTERKVACHHYISALKMLHAMFGDAPIKDPNIKNSLKNIYVGFLNHLIQMGPEKVTDDILYLPDENSCMQKSIDILVFTEDPKDLSGSGAIAYKKWNTLMIRNIDIPLVKCADALIRLPQIIRPTSFRHFVTHVLNEDSEICSEEFCEHADNIVRLFQNSLFVRVIVKLINSFEMHQEGFPAKQDEFAASIKQVSVKCYKELKITRFMRETNEALDERIVPTFWRKTEKNEIEFLVMHEVSDIGESFADNLLSILKLMCPMRSGLHESFMSTILEKLNLRRQTDSLNNILKRQLKEYEAKENYLPQLGSPLTEDLIALLDQNCCNHYEPFNYVACSVNASGNAKEIYIFGMIVKEVEKSQSNQFLRWFLVDIGEAEPVVKSTLDLYKFISADEMEREVRNTMQLQLSEFQQHDESNEKFSRSLEEVFEEVSDQLESFWKLPGNEKTKATHRMYLYWHPDKNPTGKSEYCAEVFKHVMTELDRLEKGAPKQEKRKTKKKHQFSPKQNFSRWNSQAGREKTKRQDYYKRAGSDWDYFSSSTRESGVPPSFANSSNLVAKLWYEQAEYDLGSALREAASESPCYEWVFFKHYQVARKCMIAMLLTRSTYENQNANLMELALDVTTAFGGEHGDICKIIKLMIQSGVDEVRTINPRCGKTPHDSYQQSSGGCAHQVGVWAKNLVEIAGKIVGN